MNLDQIKEFYLEFVNTLPEVQRPVLIDSLARDESVTFNAFRYAIEKIKEYEINTAKQHAKGELSGGCQEDW